MLKRTQNRIAESRWSLPITSIYAALVCLTAGFVTQQLWIQTILIAISALLMVELNNANSLIRIYSRMVSCSFLVLTTMCVFMLPSIQTAIVQLAFISFFLNIFRAYQNPKAMGWVFYAFMAIGIGSVVFVQILFFLPLFWILMATNILVFNGRTFFASLLGVLAPYWFVGAYYVYMGQPLVLVEHFIELAQFSPITTITQLDSHRIITLFFVLILAVVGSTHFLMYSFQDKIRTRMLYEMLITIDTACFIFIILQPQHIDPLLGMSIVTTSPLIGHCLALTYSKLSNICFFAIIAAILTITAYNLWMP